MGNFLLLVMGRLQFTADHQIRQLLSVNIAPVDRRNDLTEPKDRNTVGYMKHFTHFVRDENDRLPLGSQLSHDGEKPFYFGICQSR